MFSIYQKDTSGDVEIDGHVYKINVCFDTVVKLSELMRNNDYNAVLKMEVALRLLFIDYEHLVTSLTQPELIEVFSAILTDLFGDPREKADNYFTDIAGNTYNLGKFQVSDDEDSKEEMFSFKYDAEAIYASFMQAYGIDLIEAQGTLSWYKFKALLNNLPENTAFQNILHIRKQPYGKDGKANEELRRLKKLVSYPGRDFSI